jgi:hypothetical protein
MDGSVYSEGVACGKYMVCIVGDLPTVTEGNAITIGRVVVFDDVTPDAWWQYHELGHVTDQTDVGVGESMSDYGIEAAYATVLGNDPHDGNLLEQFSDWRADFAVEADNRGFEPTWAFDRSAYQAGYSRVSGGPYQWATWDAIARGGLTNGSRMHVLESAMVTQ